MESPRLQCVECDNLALPKSMFCSEHQPVMTRRSSSATKRKRTRQSMGRRRLGGRR